MLKGSEFERSFSQLAHQGHVPVLISSQILRSINAGQIDVARLTRKNQSWVLDLFEVKSRQHPSVWQWRRLLRSQDYLSKVLEMETNLKVKFCQKAEP